MGSKIPKIDMNMSLLLLGLVILVLGNIYYTFRQFNELSNRINNLRPSITQNNQSKVRKQNSKLGKSESCNPESCKPESCNPESSKIENENIIMKEMFINKQNDKVSENIIKDIQVLEDNDDDIPEIKNFDIDINIKELESDLEKLNSNENNDNNNEKINLLNSKSKKDLMEIAEGNSLSKTGTKTELVNRIVESGIEVE